MIQSVVGIKNRILKNDAAFLIGFSVALMPNLLIGSSSYHISDTVNSILALCYHPESTLSQYNGGRPFYNIRYDVEFVLLTALMTSSGYVTGRLKGLDELQAAGLAETWLKHIWQL
jgi:hypothetical protein